MSITRVKEFTEYVDSLNDEELTTLRLVVVDRQYNRRKAKMAEDKKNKCGYFAGANAKPEPQQAPTYPEE